MSLTLYFCYVEAYRCQYYDWRATVMGWLLMPFSQDFLILPVKKSNMSVKYKRQLNLTHHKHKPQNSLTQLCIEMLI